MSRLNVWQPVSIVNRTLVTDIFQLAQTVIAQYNTRLTASADTVKHTTRSSYVHNLELSE